MLTSRRPGGCGWGRRWSPARRRRPGRRARLCRHWQGLRARPQGQPAPLLQDLGNGLLLAAGHYRNGVLLAPASAEWVAERIEAGRGAT